MKRYSLTIFLLLIVSVVYPLSVSLRNNTRSPVAVMVENEPASKITIDPNKLGLLEVPASSSSKIQLYQHFKSGYSTRTRTGSIPDVSMLNRSFSITFNEANNLIAIPTNDAVRPIVSETGIKGRF